MYHTPLYCGLYLGERLVELGVLLVADVARGAQPQGLRAQHSTGAGVSDGGRVSPVVGLFLIED